MRRGLRAQGLDPGSVTPGSLSIPVFATAARLERALRISLRRLALPGRRTAVAANAAPALHAERRRRRPGRRRSRHGLRATPAAGATRVIAPVIGGVGRVGHRVIGGTAVASRPVAVAARRTSPRPARTLRRGPDHGRGAATPTRRTRSPRRTDSTGLYGAGDLGSGVTVAVYELEPVSASDIGHYQLVLRHPRLDQVHLRRRRRRPGARVPASPRSTSRT